MHIYIFCRDILHTWQNMHDIVTSHHKTPVWSRTHHDNIIYFNVLLYIWQISFSLQIDHDKIVEPVARHKNMYVELNIEIKNSVDNRHIKSKMLLNYQSGYMFLMTDRPAYRYVTLHLTKIKL